MGTDLNPVRESSRNVSVTLWAGVDDHLVHMLETEFMLDADDFRQLVPADVEEVYEKTTFTLTRFNEPVAVEAPEVGRDLLKPTDTPPAL